MDRIAAFSVVLGSAAVAAASFFIVWLRRRRARHLIRGLLEDYFAERFAAEELTSRVLASVGRRFTGRNEFFAEAVAAFQHAVNARLPPTHTAQDEAKLLKQFAALKTEFGLTDRYGSKVGGQAGNSRLNHAVPLDQRRPCPRLSANKVDHGCRSPASGSDGTANRTDPLGDRARFDANRPFWCKVIRCDSHRREIFDIFLLVKRKQIRPGELVH